MLGGWLHDRPMPPGAGLWDAIRSSLPVYDRLIAGRSGLPSRQLGLRRETHGITHSDAYDAALMSAGASVAAGKESGRVKDHVSDVDLRGGVPLFEPHSNVRRGNRRRAATTASTI